MTYLIYLPILDLTGNFKTFVFNQVSIELKFVIGKNNSNEISYAFDFVFLNRSKIFTPCIPYRIGKEPADTTREQIIYAKKLYESAFHPDTGDLQNVFGRMSFQVPGGMAITGAMLQFYRYFVEFNSNFYSFRHWRSFRLIISTFSRN